MDARAVYKKTDKGAEAIATRGHGVAGKLRMLLIPVDGKKSGEELVRLAAGMGESAQLVEQLLAEGLIEVVSGAVAAPRAGAAPAAPSAVAPAVAAGADLSKARQGATRLLAELLGPAGDDLSVRLEAAKDLSQFIDVMKRAYGLVREVKGQAAADRFGAEVEALMPKG
jgi:hypothetical protein